MPDYDQVVDQIRGIIQSSDQTRDERLEQLASDYAAACAEVNRRLGRCQSLLKQGLRSEAIQLAETEPKLLASTTALDFPERAEWDELLSLYGLAAAPRLMVDAAGFLNEAYALEEPLQVVLVEHRRLAMRRSPLRLRIELMRQLAEKDPNTLIWGDDLRSFEGARFRQIQAEAAEAVRLNDPAHIGRLVAELQQQKWIVSPPAVLVQALTKADAQLRSVHTRSRLTEIGSRLEAAFASCDTIRGRLARQDWIEVTSSARLDPSDSIWERLGPALKWLEDEDRRVAEDRDHAAAESKLLSALETPDFIPVAGVDRLIGGVLQFGHGMSEGLQQRCAARLRASERQQSRRFWLFTASGIAAASVVGIVAYSMIRSHLRQGEASQAALVINDRLELGELEQAGHFLKTLEKDDPALVSYPSLIDARQHFQEAEARETERTLQFDRALREADQAPLATIEPKGLVTARTLARRETERQAIAGLIERRRAALQAERDRYEAILGPRLDEIGRAVTEIAGQLEKIPVEAARISERIAKSQAELRGLDPQLALAGEELQGLAASLGHRLEASHARLERVLRRTRLLERLTEAVTYAPGIPHESLESFGKALEEYSQVDPDEPRAQAFRETLKERSLWAGVEAWNRLMADWKVLPDGLPPDQARKRAAVLSQFLTQHPEFPNAPELSSYVKYAEAAARREGSGSPSAILIRLFSDLLVEHVWMTVVSSKDSEGRSIRAKYYSAAHPSEQGVFFRFKSIISFGGKELVRSIPSARVTSCSLSPQSKIAAEFKPLLASGPGLARWEIVTRDLIGRLLDDSEIDPILRLALLRRILDATVDGSEILKESLGPMKVRIDQANIDSNVPWMDPEAAGLERNREAAAACVRPLRAGLPAAERIIALRDQIEKGVARTYRPVGWLVKDRRGWEIRTGSEVPRQGDLSVVVVAGDRRGDWKRIGTIKEGRPTIDTRDASVLAEGRPVFLVLNVR